MVSPNKIKIKKNGNSINCTFSKALEINVFENYNLHFYQTKTLKKNCCYGSQKDSL